MGKTRIFRVSFRAEAGVYEVYCKRVSQGDLFGFVELEDLLFGEKSAIVVDPSEERLKTEFAGVARTHVPLHAILRIDEVEKRGNSTIRAVGEKGDKVTPLPTPIYTPSKRER
jgi:hypothetical protein